MLDEEAVAPALPQPQVEVVVQEWTSGEAGEWSESGVEQVASIQSRVKAVAVAVAVKVLEVVQ